LVEIPREFAVVPSLAAVKESDQIDNGILKRRGTFKRRSR
jgi:hypothetical protein